jgi:hypothetical protein
MRGKYSPTVSRAYQRDQEWHRKFMSPDDIYDPDGYDSYGYNQDDVDRAGNHENEYYCNDDDADGVFSSGNHAYDQAYDDWGFDGVKPVKNS